MASVYTLCVWKGEARVGWGSDKTPLGIYQEP